MADDFDPGAAAPSRSFVVREAEDSFTIPAVDPLARVIVTGHPYQSPGFGTQNADGIDGYRPVHAKTLSDGLGIGVIQVHEGNDVAHTCCFLGPLVLDPLGGVVDVAYDNLVGHSDGPPPRLRDRRIIIKALRGTTGNRADRGRVPPRR